MKTAKSIYLPIAESDSLEMVLLKTGVTSLELLLAALKIDTRKDVEATNEWGQCIQDKKWSESMRKRLNDLIISGEQIIEITPGTPIQVLYDLTHTVQQNHLAKVLGVTPAEISVGNSRGWNDRTIAAIIKFIERACYKSTQGTPSVSQPPPPKNESVVAPSPYSATIEEKPEASPKAPTVEMPSVSLLPPENESVVAPSPYSATPEASPKAPPVETPLAKMPAMLPSTEVEISDIRDLKMVLSEKAYMRLLEGMVNCLTTGNPELLPQEGIEGVHSASLDKGELKISIVAVIEYSMKLEK